MTDWQSIDTAPRDGTWMLLYDGIHKTAVIAKYQHGASPAGQYGRFIWRLQEDAGALAEQSVTHWMPLPPPPVMAEGEKPLFVPLRTEWFREFESGRKDTEYRAYGPRWNETTCRVGRKATISHGYSGSRLNRVIAAFEVIEWANAPDAARAIYPDAAYIAAIHMATDAPPLPG